MTVKIWDRTMFFLDISVLLVDTAKTPYVIVTLRISKILESNIRLDAIHDVH